MICSSCRNRDRFIITKPVVLHAHANHTMAMFDVTWDDPPPLANCSFAPSECITIQCGECGKMLKSKQDFSDRITDILLAVIDRIERIKWARVHM